MSGPIGPATCCGRWADDGCPAALVSRARTAMPPAVRPTDAMAEATSAVLEAAQATLEAFCTTRTTNDPDLARDGFRAALDAAKAAVVAARFGVVETADRCRLNENAGRGARS